MQLCNVHKWISEIAFPQVAQVYIFVHGHLNEESTHCEEGYFEYYFHHI